MGSCRPPRIAIGPPAKAWAVERPQTTRPRAKGEHMDEPSSNGACLPAETFHARLEGQVLHFTLRLTSPRLFGPALENLLADARGQLHKFSGMLSRNVVWRLVA